MCNIKIWKTPYVKMLPHMVPNLRNNTQINTCRFQKEFQMNGREVQHHLTFKNGAYYDVIFIGDVLCSIRHKDDMTYLLLL